MTTMRAMAPRMLTGPGRLRPRVRAPQAMAKTMKSTEIMAVRALARFVEPSDMSITPLASAVTAKVEATMEAKAATTRISVR